jgi:hypothetical protein
MQDLALDLLAFYLHTINVTKTNTPHSSSKENFNFRNKNSQCKSNFSSNTD